MSTKVKAIQHIHSHGVICCDLKSTNILYGKRLMIIDFGGGWMVDDPMCERLVGNEYFASPRQLAFKGEPDFPHFDTPKFNNSPESKD
jgi:serine/threonine protein kinase